MDTDKSRAWVPSANQMVRHGLTPVVVHVHTVIGTPLRSADFRDPCAGRSEAHHRTRISGTLTEFRWRISCGGTAALPLPTPASPIELLGAR